ncbi:MAG: hypothetical protein WAN04_04635 [Candidatus Udaeobacter sp.]
MALALTRYHFLLLISNRKLYATCMTTQQKTTAIQAVVTNHQDNVAAVQAASVGAGLEAVVIEAMNTALKDDLAVIFALKPASARDR